MSLFHFSLQIFTIDVNGKRRFSLNFDGDVECGSLCVSVCLSVSLSVCLSAKSLSLCPSVYLYLSLSLHVCLLASVALH